MRHGLVALLCAFGLIASACTGGADGQSEAGDPQALTDARELLAASLDQPGLRFTSALVFGLRGVKGHVATQGRHDGPSDRLHVTTTASGRLYRLMLREQGADATSMVVQTVVDEPADRMYLNVTAGQEGSGWMVLSRADVDKAMGEFPGIVSFDPMLVAVSALLEADRARRLDAELGGPEREGFELDLSTADAMVLALGGAVRKYPVDSEVLIGATTPVRVWFDLEGRLRQITLSVNTLQALDDASSAARAALNAEERRTLEALTLEFKMNLWEHGAQFDIEVPCLDLDRDPDCRVLSPPPDVTRA